MKKRILFAISSLMLAGTFVYLLHKFAMYMIENQ